MVNTHASTASNKGYTPPPPIVSTETMERHQARYGENRGGYDKSSSDSDTTLDLYAGQRLKCETHFHPIQHGPDREKPDRDLRCFDYFLQSVLHIGVKSTLPRSL